MPAKLERCVLEVHNKMMNDYKDKHGSMPDKKTVAQMKSQAFAICNAQINKDK